VIKKVKPDLVHGCYALKYGFYGALSGFHPFLLIAWGSDILVGPRNSLLLRKIARYAIKKADMVYCDSITVKKGILSIAPYPEEEIVVFPQLGVDTSIFNPHNDASIIRSRLGWEDKKILIMTRLLYPVYGIEYFLQALAEVFAAVPEARAIIGGIGPLDQELKNMAMRLGIKDRISFEGWIKYEDIPKYLNSSTVYVSTSLSDGTSISLLEAIACGLPVVVTDVPSNLEWIQDGFNGFVVPRGETKELAQRLIAILTNDELREKFRERNLTQYKNKIDLDMNFNRLIAVYKKLIEKKMT
jgi:glycosyltransferase involved in cell wall biosynthesis